MLGIAWPTMRASLDAPFAGLGLLVAAMTVAQFAASDSWRPAYVIAAFAFAILGGAIYVVRSDLSAAPELDADFPEARRIGRTVILGCALMFVYVGIEVSGGQWTYTRFTADASLSDAVAGLAVFLYWSALAAGRIALAVLGDRVAPPRLFDLSVFGAMASTLGFWILPPPIAALVALPCLGATLSVFVPLLLYLTPRRIGSAAAPRAIGYQVAAGMIGGAFLPAAVGLLMQVIDVAVLGPCLVTMAAVLTGLHVVSTRPIGSRGYARQLFR